MSEFDVAFREKVMPVLSSHGLKLSEQKGRPTPENVFRRLVELVSSETLKEKRKTLEKDSAWQTVMKDLGTRFGTSNVDSTLKHLFDFYSKPTKPKVHVAAGRGKAVTAGPGMGHWRNYGTRDGVPGTDVPAVYHNTHTKMLHRVVRVSQSMSPNRDQVR